MSDAASPAASDPGGPDAPVLVVNAGSSSLKLRALPDGPSLHVERIGDPGDATISVDGREAIRRPLADAREAFEAAIEVAGAELDPNGIGLVGHRVVHGGERHVEPLLLDDDALADLDRLSPLAPLHNPANLAGIRAARAVLPHALHVAVFDTAFHAALPRRAYLYGLPMALYRNDGIRRYGFHGTSHDVVSARLADRLGRPRDELRIVTLHLGNGASAAAVQNGRSVDTTMGFTPLEGLMMGTRSGDVDPGVLLHLLRSGTTVAELDDLLNRESGVLGLSGVSNDLRDVWSAADGGDEDAAAALEVYAYRIRKTIASMAAAMGGLDALVFTGGVGENDARVRADATRGLAFLGVTLDAEANARHGPRIGAEDAAVETWVIPTDEEARIAELAALATRERRR
ncbi:MAG: acetate kinase [Trueperaceae bacterium]|nr:acetate kinase [Trueperaceae bacterium]